MEEKRVYKCSRCLHVWTSRKPKSIKCPRCQTAPSLIEINIKESTVKNA